MNVFFCLLFKKCIVKQLLNSVFAWYHELSKPRSVLSAEAEKFMISCSTSSNNCLINGYKHTTLWKGMFVTRSYCLVMCDETEEIAFTYFKVKSKATALQVKKMGSFLMHWCYFGQLCCQKNNNNNTTTTNKRRQSKTKLKEKVTDKWK